MSLSLTESTQHCFNDGDPLCVILAPATFLGTLVPAILAFYELFKEQKRGLVSKLIGNIYGALTFQGATVLKYSQGNNIEQSHNDRILFYIGLLVLMFFAIAFVIDLLKKFSFLTYSWKLFKLIYGGTICVAITLLAVLDFVADALFLQVLCLFWSFVCTFGLGALIVIALVQHDRSELPLGFYISLAGVYALWNGTVWLFVIREQGKLGYDVIPVVSVLMVEFLMFFGYCVAYQFVTEQENDSAGGLPELGYKFGGNIREETDYDSQGSPKKGSFL